MEKAKMNYLFGIRPAIEAIKSGKEIDKILIQVGLKSENYFELRSLIKEFNIPFQYVPIEKLNYITRNNHQGVIAYCSEITYYKSEDIIQKVFEEGNIPLILILDRITDVRNFGAICRTAESSGVNCIIIPSRGSAQINSEAIKTSAGALNNLPVCRSENIKTTIQYLKESGLRIISVSEKSEKKYYEIDYSMPVALILGSEENGVSSEYLKLSDERVYIPMKGQIESLNVSVAAGVVLYEALKQREQ